MTDPFSADHTVAIVLAKSAVAAAPLQEMADLAAQVEATGRVAKAVYAFSEQGMPTLKAVVHQLRDEGWQEIVILPALVPMEPAFLAWIARTLKRWHNEVGGDWPNFRIGGGPGESGAFGTIAGAMLDHQRSADIVTDTTKTVEGSIVSDRKYRVLVCQGGACNQAGAALLWGWLRQRQIDEKLVDHGAGMRSAKTTCLGPCALAPVVQVYPEGTFYGGVDEAGMDRILNEHVLSGQVVAALAYAPAERKQRLRRA